MSHHVGLHGPLYITRSLFERAQSELGKLEARAAVGDKLTAIEEIGLLLLKTSGKVPE
jgi:hypothetical protein